MNKKLINSNTLIKNTIDTKKDTPSILKQKKNI